MGEHRWNHWYKKRTCLQLRVISIISTQKSPKRRSNIYRCTKMCLRPRVPHAPVTIYIYVCRIHNMFVSLAHAANMIACEEKMTHEMVSKRNWHRQNLTKATQTFYLTLHTIGDWRKNMLERTWTLSGLTSYLINY